MGSRFPFSTPKLILDREDDLVFQVSEIPYVLGTKNKEVQEMQWAAFSRFLRRFVIRENVRLKG